MEHSELLIFFDREQRIEVTFPGFVREVTPRLVRMTPTQPPYDEGAVIYADLSAADADTVIAEQIAYFENLGYGFEWKVYTHDTPGDLPERLLRFGFVPEEPESVMVLDLADAPAFIETPQTADVRRVNDPGDVLVVLTQVWREDQKWLGPILAAELAETPDLLSIYVAFVEDAPASTAWIRFHHGSQFASLWGGSTLPEHRGRGLYTAVLGVRAREARARGVRFLTVDAGPMSRPILERLGFLLLTGTQPFKWTPSRLS